MKKFLTLMMVCMMAVSAYAAKHNVTVVSANKDLKFTTYVNGSQKNKDVSNKVVLTKMRGAKDYTVRIVFDNIKILHSVAELKLTNVTEDMELVAWIEGQQAYLMTRADYDNIMKQKKSMHKCSGNHSGCGHNCGHDCGTNQKKQAANKPEQGCCDKKK